MGRSARSATTISLSKGRVRGEVVEDGILCFQGIPFAAPPVGKLRFRRPAPPKSWKGILDCTPSRPRDTRFAKPIQFDDARVDKSESEDCLYATIWVPKIVLDSVQSRSTCPLAPVCVFVDGGGLVSGWVGSADSDGSPYARRGIICVQGNYRHGPLGFMKLVDGDANVGLWDQVELLRWVQNEIRAFGGDKDNVTVQGQSAGADLVLGLCCSPISNHLMRRVILESPSTLVIGMPQHCEVVKEFASAAGLTSAARDLFTTLSVQQLKAAYCKKAYRNVCYTAPGMGFIDQYLRSGLPRDSATGAEGRTLTGMLRRQHEDAYVDLPSLVVDFELLPKTLLDLIRHGGMARLDVIIASNRGEALGDIKLTRTGVSGIEHRIAWELAVAPGAAGLDAEALQIRAHDLVKAYEKECAADCFGLIRGGRFGRIRPKQVLSMIFSDWLYGVHAHLCTERLAQPDCCKRLYRLENIGKNGKGLRHCEGFWTVGQDISDSAGGSSREFRHIEGAAVQQRDMFAEFVRSGEPYAHALQGNRHLLKWPLHTGGESPILNMDSRNGASINHKGARVRSRAGFRALTEVYIKFWQLDGQNEYLDETESSEPPAQPMAKRARLHDSSYAGA